ncbi:hypothetical protein [Mycolicibacterium fortuitum]|uniref:hypothetical protein n=1 Tax=Mycolicibacterium fortuitum TaxID=1766 RepID=UPI0020C42FD5|nr:hypothetical protein [Mycolicibacterium fortuitum]
MSGAAQAPTHTPNLLLDNNYLDAEVVDEPSPTDRLPDRIDGLEEIMGELVDADPDLQPPDEFCKDHMPDGAGKRCVDCGFARQKREHWLKRHPDWVQESLLFGGGDSKLSRLFNLSNSVRAQEECDLCDKDGWRLDHGGRDGETPKKCDHKPQRRPSCGTCNDTGEVSGQICLHNGGFRRPPEPGELEALRESRRAAS